MNFKTLYSRTSTGTIQEWTIFVENDYYYTVYGQKDGQLVATLPSYCEGKNLGKTNETSPNNQAIKEAKAIYKKKQKEGYKENVNDIDNETFFQPMLAKKFVDYQEKIVYPVIVDNKLNGIRIILKKDGAFSRTGEEFHCVEHIKEELVPLFEKFPSLILDGELYNESLKNELNTIASLVSVNRKESDVTEEDRENARRLVQFHVYDGYNLKDVEMGHFVKQTTAHLFRRRAILALFESVALKYTFAHPYKFVNSFEEITKMMEVVKQEKREGLVIKNPDAPYENKRSKHMLKLKVFMDEEFEVVDFLEGTGNWSGKVKKVVCKLNKVATNGKTIFESNIRGTMPQLEELWNTREQHLGKKVTVDFQEFSPYGIPLIPYCDPFFRDYE